MEEQQESGSDDYDGRRQHQRQASIHDRGIGRGRAVPEQRSNPPPSNPKRRAELQRLLGPTMSRPERYDVAFVSPTTQTPYTSCPRHAFGMA
jgi:hypothetical protein